MGARMVVGGGQGAVPTGRNESNYRIEETGTTSLILARVLSVHLSTSRYISTSLPHSLYIPLYKPLSRPSLSVAFFHALPRAIGRPISRLRLRFPSPSLFLSVCFSLSLSFSHARELSRPAHSVARSCEFCELISLSHFLDMQYKVFHTHTLAPTGTRSI